MLFRPGLMFVGWNCFFACLIEELPTGFPGTLGQCFVSSQRFLDRPRGQTRIVLSLG